MGGDLPFAALATKGGNAQGAEFDENFSSKSFFSSLLTLRN